MAADTTLQDLGELFRLSRMLISSDTGPLHLAAAVGTPCVGLFGPVPAARNGPYGSGHVCVEPPRGLRPAWDRPQDRHRCRWRRSRWSGSWRQPSGCSPGTAPPPDRRRSRRPAGDPIPAGRYSHDECPTGPVMRPRCPARPAIPSMPSSGSSALPSRSRRRPTACRCCGAIRPAGEAAGGGACPRAADGRLRHDDPGRRRSPCSRSPRWGPSGSTTSRASGSAASGQPAEAAPAADGRRAAGPEADAS